MATEDLYVDEDVVTSRPQRNHHWMDYIFAVVGSIVDLIFGGGSNGGGGNDSGDAYQS